jgi:hypothetical protein
MGVSLSYWSVQKPPRDVVGAIKEDADRINATRQWWSERLRFFDWKGHEGHLAGDTKLMPLAYFGQIDDDENAFMAARDVFFILAQLKIWWEKHGIDWRIDCEGQEGFIIGGELDSSAQQLVADWKQMAGISDEISDADIESKAAQILA